jgi:hypothetical protein
MSKKLRKICAVCKKSAAKKIDSKIGYLRVDATKAFFCSRRCAADYGLLMANDAGEDALHWCPKHGWFSGASYDNECFECPPENSPQD